MAEERQYVPLLAYKPDGTSVIVAGLLGYVTEAKGLFVVPGIWYSVEADTFLPHRSFLVAVMGQGDDFGVTVVEGIDDKQTAFGTVRLLAPMGDWYHDSRNLIDKVGQVLDTTDGAVVG